MNYIETFDGYINYYQNVIDEWGKESFATGVDVAKRIRQLLSELEIDLDEIQSIEEYLYDNLNFQGSGWGAMAGDFS